MVPRYFLYGEPHRSVDECFVHVESLDDRSRPGNWTIRPHAHAQLSHIFHIAEGGGVMQVDDRRLEFAAPCLLTIPAGAIHGFRWIDESHGHVVTLDAGLLGDLLRQDRVLDGLFETVGAVKLTAAQSREMRDRRVRLTRELAVSIRGRDLAIRTEILGMLLIALRASADPNRAAAPGRHAALAARLQRRVEAQFRLGQPMGAYAKALGVTLRQLREACRRQGLPPPGRIVDQRLMAEARRALIYSDQSIAEIAESLGFPDPAYFSRFFSRNAGCAPRVFRRDGGMTRR